MSLPERPPSREDPCLLEGPRANIEIKARMGDPEAAARKARELGARFAGEDHQIDTYFRVPRGRLKLRRSSLGGDQIVIYVRPDATGPRRSDYEILPVPNAARTLDLLEAMLGAEAVVRKTRRVWLLRGTRIHLDTVEGLGQFIEFEAVHGHGDPEGEANARREVDRLVEAFGIDPSEIVPGSYREMVPGGGR